MEFPTPQISSKMILVKNHYSLISAGTESSSIKGAQKSLLKTAIEKPEKVLSVFKSVSSIGVSKVIDSVKSAASTYSSIGYSCAGEVIAVSDDVKEFKVGDLVACGGAGYAVHSEVVAVPINLCVKLTPDADLSKACYNTLGSIALQGVRQADLKLGEICAVIGLGLVGQLTCLMLRASGVRVVGIDISEKAVNISKQHCTDISICRGDESLEQKINYYTEGMGVDGVIITAGTSSLDPINLAGKIARKKAVVVVVGAIPTGFDRGSYYMKELTLKMSCSYGPGRYDNSYEENGVDYPYAYVRWTEKRNMQAFQNLISNNKIDISYLTTHIYDFSDAARAYTLLMSHSEYFMGLVLKYDVDKHYHFSEKYETHPMMPIENKVCVSFIGAGGYAKSSLLPHLKRNNNVFLSGVLNSTGVSSRKVAEFYKFKYSASNEDDIFSDENTNVVFITTRHNLHAKYVLKAIEKGKNVYVEKPLCIFPKELELIKSSLKKSNLNVMVGFNRRFSPHTDFIKKYISTPCTMLYRINAGFIPLDSWVHDREIGGGRILGEVCHFIDYMNFISNSKPISLTASQLDVPGELQDCINIMLNYRNGSTGVIVYNANGAKNLEKEYFEVHSMGISASINDFNESKVYLKDKIINNKTKIKDKGQSLMVEKYIDNIKEGKALISINEILNVSEICFAILESLREPGKTIQL